MSDIEGGGATATVVYPRTSRVPAEIGSVVQVRRQGLAKPLVGVVVDAPYPLALKGAKNQTVEDAGQHVTVNLLFNRAEPEQRTLMDAMEHELRRNTVPFLPLHDALDSEQRVGAALSAALSGSGGFWAEWPPRD